MGLEREGIQQAREASKIFKQLGEVVEQAYSLITLAWLLCDGGQLDAAEETGLHAINLLPENGEGARVCLGHRVLGFIYRSKGNMKKAVHFVTKANSRMHRFTLNAPSRTRPTTRTI